jgi:hypothetical protein
MSPAERRELVRRLTRMSHDGWPMRPRRFGPRELQVSTVMASCVVLIPWTVYLATTLPQDYVTTNWRPAWVGFDVFLLVLMAATAVLGYLRRQLVMFTAFAVGVLLLCDAWFDVTLSTRRGDHPGTLAGLLLELPLAVLLIVGALGLFRRVSMRTALVDPGGRAWQVAIPVPHTQA